MQRNSDFFQAPNDDLNNLFDIENEFFQIDQDLNRIEYFIQEVAKIKFLDLIVIQSKNEITNGKKFSNVNNNETNINAEEVQEIIPRKEEEIRNAVEDNEEVIRNGEDNIKGTFEFEENIIKNNKIVINFNQKDEKNYSDEINIELEKLKKLKKKIFLFDMFKKYFKSFEYLKQFLNFLKIKVG